MNASEEPSAPRRHKVVIAGVGGIGCHMVRKVRETIDADFKVVLINTDERSFGTDPTVVNVSLLAAGRGTGSRSARGRALAESRIQEIEAAMGDAQIVIIVAALGGGTGSGATPVVLTAAAKAGSTPILVAISPDGSDSPRCHQNAAEALGKIQPLVSTLIVRQLDAAADVPEEAESEFVRIRPLREAAEWVVLVVRDLIAILDEEGQAISAYDSSDLEEWLRQKGKVIWASATAKGTSRAADACIEALRSNRKDSKENAQASATLCVVSGREAPTIADIKAVLAIVRDWMGPLGLLIFYAREDARIAEDSRRVTLVTKAPRRRDVLSLVSSSP